MKIKRAIHVDFHTLPNIYDFGYGYDAEQFAQTLFDAGVEYVNLVACCNIGFCYFPTEVGVKYPYMDGDRFGDTLAALKKRGIGVSAYINVGLSHENALRHPDWVRVNKKRQTIYGDTTGNFFRMMDYNSDGFRQYLFALIKEIDNRYDVDGFFFDGFKIKDCYCDKCLAERKSLGLDEEDSKSAKDFAYSKMQKLCREILEIIGDKHVFFCGMRYEEVFHDHIEVECLPSGNWGYDYFNQAAAYARGVGRRLDRDVLYMTGRFQDDWGDFGGIRSKASFEYDIYDALANGFQISIGDHLHPAGNLNSDLYATIGELYADFSRYENALCGARYKAEIGILVANDLFDFELAEYIGATRVLNELKYSYDLIPPTADFSLYKAIVLCDEYLLDEETADKLSSYVQKGGKILSSGYAGLNRKKQEFAMREYSFLEYCGADKGNSPYFVLDNDESKNTQWAEYESGILMKNVSGTRLANYIRPYNKRFFDGKHGYFYTPPERETGYASAVYKDGICHISFRIFTAYATRFLSAHRTLIQQALERLIDTKLIKTDLPVYTRLNITEKDANTYLHVRTTFAEKKNAKGVIEEHITLASGYVVCVLGEYRQATDFLSGENLQIQYKDGYTHITLPTITGYKVILLKD
ncbi:MAG: alpha-L-fucosidase [Clostridia bacterium]|nr:alpha-L-fucosidase [Clostridia bacterium]